MPKVTKYLKLRYFVDFNKKFGTMARFVRVGINPTPTQQLKRRLVGAGFTPARARFRHVGIAQIRY
jgi:hypothetical protein